MSWGSFAIGVAVGAVVTAVGIAVWTYRKVKGDQ